MRKLIAILLLLSFCVQLGGFQIYFHFKREHLRDIARFKIRHQKDEDNTITLVFTNKDVATEIFWEKEGEFRYAGEMYDVVTMQSHKNKLIIVCKKDEKERKLVDNFNKMLKDQLPIAAKNKRNAWLIQLFNTYFQPTDFTQKLIIENISPDYWVRMTHPLFTRNAEVLTPPPKIFT